MYFLPFLIPNHCVLSTSNSFWEVKWSDKPDNHDARHLKKFIAEYNQADQGFVVCRTPARYQINSNIIALPWQNLFDVLKKIAKQ